MSYRLVADAAEAIEQGRVPWTAHLPPDRVTALAGWLHTTSRYMRYEAGSLSAEERGPEFYTTKYPDLLRFAAGVLEDAAPATPDPNPRTPAKEDQP